MISPGEDFGGARLDSSNQMAVLLTKRNTVQFRSPPWNEATKTDEYSAEQALNLAAWIVCLVDPERRTFNRLIAEIQK